MDEILWRIIIPLIVGFIGAGGGVYVGYAVLKEKVTRLEKDKDELKAKMDSQEREFREAIEKHNLENVHTFGRVVFRDSCNQCGKFGDERHAEIIRAMSEIKKENAETRTYVRDCMDLIVKEFKRG